MQATCELRVGYDGTCRWVNREALRYLDGEAILELHRY